MDNKKHNHEEVKNLAEALKVSPIVAALLISRGYGNEEDAHKFLNPSYDQCTNFLNERMKEAVGRILKAIEKKEKILIWGDYDVDGTTGTVFATGAGNSRRGKPDSVPNRFTEGYGINIPTLEKVKVRFYSRRQR